MRKKYTNENRNREKKDKISKTKENPKRKS